MPLNRQTNQRNYVCVVDKATTRQITTNIHNSMQWSIPSRTPPSPEMLTSPLNKADVKLLFRRSYRSICEYRQRCTKVKTLVRVLTSAAVYWCSDKGPRNLEIVGVQLSLAPSSVTHWKSDRLLESFNNIMHRRRTNMQTPSNLSLWEQLLLTFQSFPHADWRFFAHLWNPTIRLFMDISVAPKQQKYRK